MPDKRETSERRSPGSRDVVFADERLVLGGILLITLAIYLRSLGNGFVWDDALIVGNRHLGEWSFLWRSLVSPLDWSSPLQKLVAARYRPVLSIFLALNYHLFGSNAGAWHATTIALHLLAVTLAFKVAIALTGERGPALLAALLFALNPVSVEAVAWLSGSALVLSANFQLGALLFFLKRHGAPLRNWCIAFVLFGLALLSHEISVAFPGLIVLCVLLLEGFGRPGWKGRGRQLARAAALAAPFATEVLLYLGIRRLVFGSFFPRQSRLIVSGGQAIIFDTLASSTAQVLLTLPRMLLDYLMLLAMPWMAGPAHHALFVNQLGSPDFYVPFAALTVLAIGFAALVRRDPRRPLYLFCAAWILTAIAPRMYPFALDQNHLVHDSYLYLPSFGWCLMVGDNLARQAHAGRWQRNLAFSAATALSVVYAAALWRLQPVWRDDIAVFTGCVRGFPDSAYYHTQLARAFKQRGELSRANTESKIADRLENPESIMELGKIAVAQGRLADGTAQIADALGREAQPSAADYALLAELYDTLGESANSAAALKRAESRPGGAEESGLARAQIATQRGDPKKAEAILQDLARSYPGDHRVWMQLGIALSAQSRLAEALVAIRRALELAPSDPILHVFAGSTLHAAGRDEEALNQCREALALKPDEPHARALIDEIARGRSAH